MVSLDPAKVSLLHRLFTILKSVAGHPRPPTWRCSDCEATGRYGRIRHHKQCKYAARPQNLENLR